jgi:hypothetical protein
MRCPVCKAENLQGPNCRRCKADLSLLFALQEGRRRVLDEARRRFAEADWVGAARLAVQADGMQTDDESRNLLALARLLNGAFAEAWEVYRKGRGRSADRPVGTDSFSPLPFGEGGRG